MSNEKKEPEGFDEEELIRSEFESIVSGLNLDQSAPTTYLDDLDRIDNEGFVQMTGSIEVSGPNAINVNPVLNNNTLSVNADGGTGEGIQSSVDIFY